jgi:hypothetical protein
LPKKGVDMASVFSNYAINYATIDINLLVRAQTQSSLLDNVNYSYNGQVYEDVAQFQYFSKGHVLASFGGSGISADANGYVTNGTVTGFIESVWNGSAWLNAWGMQSISYPAVSIGNAALTLDTADDMAIIENILNGDDLMSLSSYSDIMRGYEGDDIMAGNSGGDTLYGDRGNDVLRGGSGNDALYGGEGVDTADFVGFLNQYLIGQGTVADQLANRDGTDLVTGIERLSFADSDLALDVGHGQTAGVAYRLYSAAFDRTPDEAGLGHWIDRLDHGADLVKDVAQSFINSQEFQSTYGPNISDHQFITLLYNNVLDRNPDQGGLAFWNTQMAQGLSRAEVLVNFSESSENVADVAELIASGIHYEAWAA